LFDAELTIAIPAVTTSQCH